MAKQSENKLKESEEIGQGLNEPHIKKVLRARKDIADLRKLQPFTASYNEWELLKKKAQDAGYTSISKYARIKLGINLKD